MRNTAPGLRRFHVSLLDIAVHCGDDRRYVFSVNRFIMRIDPVHTVASLRWEYTPW
jgi:hypothetical protein